MKAKDALMVSGALALMLAVAVTFLILSIGGVLYLVFAESLILNAVGWVIAVSMAVFVVIVE